MIHNGEKDNENFDSGSRGAAMLEFALVAGLFFTVVLTFLDLAHYFTVRMMLIRAAQQALSVACMDPRLQGEFFFEESLPIADSTTVTVSSDPASNYSRYLGARGDVVTAASQYPLGPLVSPPNSGGIVELMTFKANDEYQNGVQAIDGFNAAIVRPGEGWYSNLQGRVIAHPSVCTKAVDASCGSPRPKGMGMRQMLQSYPIMIVLEARKRSFLAWGRWIPITASAVGWAQIYPKSPYDVKDFVPTANVVPTPTPPPCPKDPPDCQKWIQWSCKCADEQPCPTGEHWDPQEGDPHCSKCPFAYSWIPGEAPNSAPTCPPDYHYIDWACQCGCPDNFACHSGASGGYGGTCSNCLPEDGIGDVGH